MRFCEKCGNLMYVKRKRKVSYLVCRKCKKEIKLKDEKILVSQQMAPQKKRVIFIGKDEGLAEFPKTKIMCPKCGNMEAYWWMQQTRSADEPPTIFYKCAKCGYSWRTYG